MTHGPPALDWVKDNELQGVATEGNQSLLVSLYGTMGTQ